MDSSPLPDLQLTEDDRKVINLLDAEPPSQARHCFRSAINHLRRAQVIQDIDPAMAIFRGITAEEEAASGLMHAFIQRNYPNANLLKPKVHLQKHAITPYLRFLLHHLAEIKLNGVRTFRLAIQKIDGLNRLTIVLLLEGEGEEMAATPLPPLNFSVREGDGGGFPDISRNIRELLGPVGYTNVQSFLKNEANLRNRILYAGPDGYPSIQALQPEFILDRQRRVLNILKVALLILPYDEIQPFASEALASFLRLLNRLSEATNPIDT